MKTKTKTKTLTAHKKAGETKKRFLVIGNSAAGLACIESIRKLDPVSQIVNVSAEPHRPYSRCLLSYYLAGAIDKERLWIRSKDFYKELKVEPYLGETVVAIDEKAKKATLSNKKILDYDKLMFASGGSPKKIVLKGIDKGGVFYLRTLDDADGIIAALNGVKAVAILGGGLIGMRAAYSLRKRDKQVHVLVKSSHIFSQMLDFESADMIKGQFESNGIKISTGVEVVEILGKEKVEGVLLDDGNRLDCQLIIIGKGVSANVDILKGKVKINEGVVVDEALKTSNDFIYAAGDVAETFDILEQRPAINAIWPAAVRQGKIAGVNMAGAQAAYEGSCGMNSVEFFGMSAISFGQVRPKQDGFEELTQANFSKNIYRKVVLKDNRIVGGILVNDVEKHGIILNLALQKINISDIKDILVDEYFDYAKAIPLIKRQEKSFVLPEYADTCSTYSPIL